MYTLVVHKDAVKELNELPEPANGRMLFLLDLIKEFGYELKMPHSKPLGGGLFELRTQGKDGIARCIYIFKSEKRVVLLHAFIKKTQKTPSKALATARKRLDQIIDD